MWWNYVARERSEITAAHDAWLADEERFGSVASPLSHIEVGPPPWRSRRRAAPRRSSLVASLGPNPGGPDPVSHLLPVVHLTQIGRAPVRQMVRPSSEACRGA